MQRLRSNAVVPSPLARGATTLEQNVSRDCRSTKWDAIALDLDGVILESVRLKCEAMASLFADEPYAQDIREWIYAHHSVGRREQLEHILRRWVGTDWSEEVIIALFRRFAKRVAGEMRICPFVAGAQDLLQLARVPLFLVSSMPREEIDGVLQDRGLARFFREVHGAPGRKADQLRSVVRRYGLARKRVVFVGDSLSDHAAAAEARVAFVGRRNLDDFTALSVPVFADLRGVARHLDLRGET